MVLRTVSRHVSASAASLALAQFKPQNGDEHAFVLDMPDVPVIMTKKGKNK